MPKKTVKRTNKKKQRPIELSADQLCRICDPSRFKFKSTDELPFVPEIIGQPRATRAIQFGIDIQSPGFNIYVLGPAGTGRTTTIERFLTERAAREPTPDDWVYVHNFVEPDKPRAIRLPPGLGCQLRADMERLVEHLQRDLPRAFEEKIAFTVGHGVDELKAKYAAYEEVGEYLEEVRADIIEHAEDFKPEREPPSPPMEAAAPAPLKKYLVNVIVDNGHQEGAPVVVEGNPTFYNLIGRIEHQVRFGGAVTDFTMLKGGALHRANGGYLVLRAKEVLADPFAWQALKRALADGEVQVEELGVQYRLLATVTLEPEPIPLDVKVVLLGSPSLYYTLHAYDEDFRKLFKVQADFASEMDRTPENEDLYAAFIRARCQEEGLPPFEPGSVAKVIEYGSRLAEDQEKLSTRFGDVADIVREASYWAGRNGREVVTAADVAQAIREKTYRAKRVEERVQEVIARGTIFIDVTGEVIGQVNGLSVNAVGEHLFGRPLRITARTYMGRTGVVDILREAKLSGPLHSKGVMTLIGYLGGQYALQQPLSLSASLSFEQTYDEVDGESAASTELYALLSSLSGLPLKQGLAVTGSVNQKGEIQPVGGVTHKVEGFFEVCKAKGLTGDQGVLIPAQNVRNLMLRDEVVQAVAEGKFHLYAVATVDQAIELLTGVEAGERDTEGKFPPGSVHAAVEARLQELAEGLEKFGKAKEQERESGGEEGPEGGEGT